MKITEKEINVITGEETITEREETAMEEKERLADLAAEEAYHTPKLTLQLAKQFLIV